MVFPAQEAAGQPLADEATSAGKSGSLGARGVALKDRPG